MVREYDNGDHEMTNKSSVMIIRDQQGRVGPYLMRAVKLEERISQANPELVRAISEKIKKAEGEMVQTAIRDFMGELK
jgi:hypothetical protein